MVEPEEVARWLDENVRRYPPCRRVKLSDFKWEDRTHYGGEFLVAFDDASSREQFSFFADGAGEFQFSPPLFASPLGAPATFSAIDVPEQTEKAIRCGLAYAVPRLKPFGIDPATGLHLTGSPLTARLIRPLDEVRAHLLRADFCVEVDVATLRTLAG